MPKDQKVLSFSRYKSRVPWEVREMPGNPLPNEPSQEVPNEVAAVVQPEVSVGSERLSVPAWMISGRVFEGLFVPPCDRPDFEVGELPFGAALQLAICTQPQCWDSRFPRKKASRHLHAAVLRHLRWKGKRFVNLSLYTAIGSALDLQHGVDMFFVRNARAVATVDLTLNPGGKKYRNYKGHFILSPNNLGTAEFDSLAQGIARALLREDLRIEYK